MTSFECGRRVDYVNEIRPSNVSGDREGLCSTLDLERLLRGDSGKLKVVCAV